MPGHSTRTPTRTPSTRTLSAVLAAGAALAGVVVAAPAHAAASAARSTVRRCHDDFASLTPDQKHGKRVHAPSNVTRPTGIAIPAGMGVYGVANDLGTDGALRYQTLAGPTAFVCSGAALSEDDVSWATFRSAKTHSHSLTATFMLGQGAFPAECEYLAAAHRHKAARQAASLYSGKVSQCREETEDTPAGSRIRPIFLTGKRSGPIAIVIHARKGTEYTGPAVTHAGHETRPVKTTTPTISVAVLSWKSKKSYTWPQTMDCSLTASQHKTCAKAGAVFLDQALQGTYGWSASAAARAARKVESAAH